MDDKELIEVWRAEFQEKCAPMFSNLHAFGTKPFYFHKSGEYFFANVESAWQGFLIAKRSQPSVVLPKGHLMDDPDGMGRGRYLMIESVERAITRAGYSYEVKE